jgi:general secretion pathway protein A
VYLKYFGFRELPFNLTPDPKFFFDSPLHREAWASLFYGINEKKGFVVVTGEVGTGKTTLIRKVLRSLEATHHSVFIFNTRVTFDELLETILRDLELDQPQTGRVALLERLNDFLLEKVKIGHVVSILIDEAQNLSEDALEGVRLLSNMETDRQKLVQIILVGQPELDLKLNSRSLRQLKQRVSLWCRLDRLSQADTEAYIRHRLQVAGYQGVDIFPGRTIQSIWESTSGIPRLINAVCDNALLTAFATSKKIVSPDIILEAVRDLRIESETQRAEFIRTDGKDLLQPSRKSVGSVTELGDAKIGGKSRRPEDQERPWFAHNAAAAAAEIAPNLLEEAWNGDGITVSEVREFKRPHARMIASVADLREKKDAQKGHVVDIGENPWPAGTTSENANVVVRRSKGIEDPGADIMVSPDFFEDMVVALTAAMGPMASFVIKDQSAALGESLQQFPLKRLPDLVQSIKREILSDGLRRQFEEHILRELQKKNKPWN